MYYASFFFCTSVKNRRFAYCFAQRPLVHRDYSLSDAKWTKWTSKWFSKASCLCRWGTNQELFNEFANISMFLFNRLNKTRVFATHFTHTNRKERPCFLSPNNYVSFPLLCLIETWDTIIILFIFKNNGQIIWWIQRKMFLLHFIKYET